MSSAEWVAPMKCSGSLYRGRKRLPLSAPWYIRPECRTTNNEMVRQEMQGNEGRDQMRWQVSSRLGQTGETWGAGGAGAASAGITLAFGGDLVSACFSLGVLVASRSFHLSLIAFPTRSQSPLSWPLMLRQQFGLFYLFSSYDSGISFCKLGKLFHISSYIVSGFGAFFPFIEPLLKLWSLGPVNYSAIWYKNMAYVYISLCLCVWEQVKIITKKKKKSSPS